jgi:nitrite reductase/ring-hydroxylating ferredoxin subunit
MTRTRITTVDDVPADGSELFTIRERDGSEEEVILVRCSDPMSASGSDADSSTNSTVDGDSNGVDGNDERVNVDEPDGTVTVRAWRNFCQHETDQRLDRGFGAAVRGGEIVCPKHGSMFDTCSGYCDNGKAADSYLSEVDVAVDDGVVYLTDSTVEFAHEGGIDDDEDEGPGSTSHLSF